MSNKQLTKWSWSLTEIDEMRPRIGAPPTVDLSHIFTVRDQSPSLSSVAANDQEYCNNRQRAKLWLQHFVCGEGCCSSGRHRETDHRLRTGFTYTHVERFRNFRRASGQISNTLAPFYSFSPVSNSTHGWTLFLELAEALTCLCWSRQLQVTNIFQWKDSYSDTSAALDRRPCTCKMWWSCQMWVCIFMCYLSTFPF